MPRFDVTLTNPEAVAGGSVTASLHARDESEAIAAARRGYPGYVVASVTAPTAPPDLAALCELPPSPVNKPR